MILVIITTATTSAPSTTFISVSTTHTKTTTIINPARLKNTKCAISRNILYFFTAVAYGPWQVNCIYD